jgi:hypothetical protein
MNNDEVFIKELSWSAINNFEPIISIYWLSKIDSKRIDISIFDNIYNFKKANYSELSIEESESSARIEVLDFHFYKESMDYKKFVAEIMKLILSNGALFTWSMIEGGLVNINNLFKQWEIESTYAMCFPFEEPSYAFDITFRKSKEWAQLFIRVNELIDQFNLHP